MSAEDGGGHGPAPRSVGFHAYADDTIRDDLDEPADVSADADWPRDEAEAPWPDDGLHEPEAGRAYTSADADRPQDAPRPRTAPPLGRFVAAAGVALVFAGGLWLGRTLPEPGAEPAAPQAASAAQPKMDVEVAQVEPPPTPPLTGGRLEVLAPEATAGRMTAFAPIGRAADTAAGTPRIPPAETAAPSQPAWAVTTPARRIEPERVEPERVEPQRGDPPGVAPLADASRAPDEGSPLRTSYDCRDAPTPARAMVCSDQRLAALDRTMRRAYDTALAAGLPQAALRADQDDWLDVREDAARHSRSAVAQIYRQRIEELRDLAENGDFPPR